MKNQKHAVRYANRNITVVNSKHEARKGSKRAKALDLMLRSKNTTNVIPKLKKLGADTSFIRFAVEQGFIKLSKAA